jgi:hypothetical protein
MEILPGSRAKDAGLYQGMASAVTMIQKTTWALAPDVRWMSCQGLKPLSKRAFFGTAEAMP